MVVVHKIGMVAMERWKQNLYLVGIAQLMGFGSISFVMSFLPLYVKSLGISDPGAAAAWSGVLMGVSAFFASISAPIWGNIGDRVGRKPMVERVLFVNTILIVLLGLASNVWHVLILRSLQGALGGFSPAAIALVTSITPAAEVGFALGFYQFAMTVGLALGPLLGGYLADTVSFRTAFFVMAGLSLVAALLVRFSVFEKFTRPQGNKKGESFITSLKQLLSSRSLLILFSVNLLVQFSLIIVAPIVPLFIHSLDPASTRVTTMTGLILASGGVSSAISAVYLGRISDRVGPKRILVGCALGAAFVTLLQVAVVSPWQFLALRIVGGAFTGGMLPSSNTLINRLIPRERKGTAFGVAASFSMMGVVFGPITGGLLGASPVGYRGVFAITAVLLLLTAIWVKGAVKAGEGTTAS